MKKFGIFILVVILCICGYKAIRKHINTNYGCNSSITYSAGDSSEWSYGNQRKEFKAGSACYARVGESIYTGYYGAVTPQVRQVGNCLSGLTETACASLLA